MKRNYRYCRYYLGFHSYRSFLRQEPDDVSRHFAVFSLAIGVVLALGQSRAEAQEAEELLPSILTFRRWRRQFPAIFCGWLAGRGSQVPRTRSHRLTHQPDGPLAATHRAARPGHATSPRRPHSRYCRQLSPLTTRLPKNPLPPASFRNVAPFGKRSDRADPLAFHLSQILCF